MRQLIIGGYESFAYESKTTRNLDKSILVDRIGAYDYFNGRFFGASRIRIKITSMTGHSRSVVFLLISVVFLGISGIVAWKGYEKYREKERVASQVSRLRDEAERIKSETAQLDERIAYMRTPEYAEREVKEKLNLKKPEESVAVVQSGSEKQREELGEKPSVSVEPSVKTTEGNPKKWWDFFFAPVL